MYASQLVPANIQRFGHRWPPAPHQSLPSGTANGARLHLSDHTHANDEGPAPKGLFLPSHAGQASSTLQWGTTPTTLFSPPTHPYQPLPVELEVRRTVTSRRALTCIRSSLPSATPPGSACHNTILRLSMGLETTASMTIWTLWQICTSTYPRIARYLALDPALPPPLRTTRTILMSQT